MSKKTFQEVIALRCNPTEILAAVDWRSTPDKLTIRKTKYLRYLFDGVPGRHADILVARHVLELDASPNLAIVIIANKTGCHDGRVRRRCRVFQNDPRHEYAVGGRITVTSDNSAEYLAIVAEDNEGKRFVDDEYKRLDSNLSLNDLGRVMSWHWGRYYKHLWRQDGVREAIDAWVAENQDAAANWSKNQANREASRALYRISRDLGWVKLSAYQRKLYQVEDKGAWQRHDYILRLAAERKASTAMLTGSSHYCEPGLGNAE